MANETICLAEYAAGLHYDDLPPDVVQRAKDCITDTVAVIVLGNRLPWSRIVVHYAQRTGAGGRSRILGADGPAVQAPAAALANGALAHAFEFDNLTRPGAGVHPGATLLPPALAIAQEHGRSGRDLITAIVAGFEVMYRIGRATKHSNERRGFHAPGTTGPFGAAVAAGRLLRLDADAMANALGIAGSLACGLMEFARSGTGAMVKRLHLGRAAESGVLAASLAADGFTGPHSVLEGEAGFLKVFCTEWDLADLTHGLGSDFATLNLCLKRFPVHMTAQTAVQAILELQAEHGFSGVQVDRVIVAGNERMATINNIPDPTDIMMAQYSIPFCMALALFRDPRDPVSFDESALVDADIRAMSQRVTVTVADPPTRIAGASIVTVWLKNGRSITREVEEFDGTPARPLNRAELREKFMMLMGARRATQATELFDRLQNLENEADTRWLGAF
ncbi:MAG TPA: MmgE/PrpD family protein [Acetobacteraceae bacterium]|nr:MmgE/PrpD family protein [Acetobacteraceae bacterium]